jgi:hypothetical protein
VLLSLPVAVDWDEDEVFPAEDNFLLDDEGVSVLVLLEPEDHRSAEMQISSRY